MADDTQRGDPGPAVVGVQELIDRLRQDGVDSGRSEAERLIEEARQEKRRILQEAEREAQQRKEAARQEIDGMKQAAHDALQQAARDTVLGLRQQMLERFSEDVRRLVSEAIQEEAVVRQLILTIAGRAREALDRDGSREIEVVLPAKPPGLDDLRRRAATLQQDELMRLVMALTGDRLRQGLTFRIAERDRGGIQVIAKDSAIEFDLTEEAMAELILEHLQPRFRALLEGLAG